ncbi:MAG: 2,3-diaminopropionate biosynthesis protein SbnB [Xanthobacteraceae bacterium]
MSKRTPDFSVITGQVIGEIIREDVPRIVDLITGTYRAHAAHQTVNPPSQFLRFPKRPNARIISLPAYVGGDGRPVSGVKWIASYPDNVKLGIPRASAVLLLNDPETGYPVACLEGSLISAARTAASAVLAADWLCGHALRVDRIGFVGTGFIARSILDFLVGMRWRAGQIFVCDLQPGYAQTFAAYVESKGWPAPEIVPSASRVMKACELTIFATTAARPHVTGVNLLKRHPRVLHISLRDLAPEIILAADNIVDDVEHCLTADTSPHLAEQLIGNRSFVTGTIADVVDGRVRLDPDRPVIFSPFGMGILDIALGRYVHERALATKQEQRISGFFPLMNGDGVLRQSRLGPGRP